MQGRHCATCRATQSGKRTCECRLSTTRPRVRRSDERRPRYERRRNARFRRATARRFNALLLCETSARRTSQAYRQRQESHSARKRTEATRLAVPRPAGRHRVAPESLHSLACLPFSCASTSRPTPCAPKTATTRHLHLGRRLPRRPGPRRRPVVAARVVVRNLRPRERLHLVDL